MRTRLQGWLRFVRSESHVFRDSPAMLFQTAANAFEFEDVSQAALRRFEEGREQRLWFRAVNRLPRHSHRRFTLSTHSGAITTCAFSPDGSKILSASTFGTVHVSSATTGLKILELPEFNESSDEEYSDELNVEGVTLFEDATPEENSKWEWLGSGAKWKRAGRQQRPVYAAFSPDGTQIYALSQSRFAICDAASGSKLFETSTKDGFTRFLAFSRDGERLALETFDAVSNNFSIKILNLESRQEVLISEHLPVAAHCTFSPDGSLLLMHTTASDLYNSVTGQLVRSTPDKSNFCCFSPDESLLLCIGEREVALWSFPQGELLFALPDKYSRIRSASFSADSKRVLLGAADGSVTLVDVLSREEVYSWSGHSAPVDAVGFSPDGTALISASSDATVKVWDNQPTGISESVSHEAKVVFCSFSPDAQRIITSSLDATVRIWDGNTCALLRTIAVGLPVHGCALSPDGKSVAVVVQREVRIIELETGATIKVIGPLRRALNACAFSPNGERLLVAGNYGLLSVLNLATGQAVKTLNRTDDVSSCAFSPTAEYALAGEYNGHVSICITGTGSCVVLSGHRAAVTSVAFSPDSHVWISSSRDGTIRHWKGRDGGRVFCGHSASVNDCAFSTAGDYLLSASDDGRLRIWRVETGEELAHYHCDDSITRLAWSRDGSHIVLGMVAGGVQLLKIEGELQTS